MLVEMQREAARNTGKGLVAEGRDLGTVVSRCDPRGSLTADVQARAERRAAEK